MAGEVIQLDEESVRVQNCGRATEDISTTANLLDVPVFFCGGVEASEVLALNYAPPQSESDSLHAAEERRENVFRDFVRQVFTWYCSLMNTHVTICRNNLDALYADS